MKCCNKKRILAVLQADLRHYQLINGLARMHIQTDHYHLELYEIVATMMGLGEEVPDSWFKVYDQYLATAHTLPINGGPESLLPAAKRCYKLLKASIK